MAAGARSCVDCGVRAATVTVEGAAVCDRCFERRVAARTGHAELPDPPPEEQIVGPDGSDLSGGLLDLDDIDDEDDEDDEEFLRQWDEAEHEAAALIREALPQVVAAGPPQEAVHTAAASIRAAREHGHIGTSRPRPGGTGRRPMTTSSCGSPPPVRWWRCGRRAGWAPRSSRR